MATVHALRAGMALLFWLLAASSPAQECVPLRFALTFDDGPDGAQKHNSTEIVLDTLAHNPVQDGIKAVFFIQTRSSNGGATPHGRALMRREQAEGHVLALHDGSTWGHRSHRNLSDQALEESLADGIADLLAVTGRSVTLVRPPYWAFDARTSDAYGRHGLIMLLTDISANDGKDWGFRASPRRYSHMASEMAHLRERCALGEIPEIDGVSPVVVTFHDTNDYTADHLAEYLAMLVDQAREMGFTLADKPYFDQPRQLENVALLRALGVVQRVSMVPWWWRWIEW